MAAYTARTTVSLALTPALQLIVRMDISHSLTMGDIPSIAQFEVGWIHQLFLPILGSTRQCGQY